MNSNDYTIDDVANILQVSNKTIYKLIKRQQLKAFKVGRLLRIAATDLQDFKDKMYVFNVNQEQQELPIPPSG